MISNIRKDNTEKINFFIKSVAKSMFHNGKLSLEETNSFKKVMELLPKCNLSKETKVIVNHIYFKSLEESYLFDKIWKTGWDSLSINQQKRENILTSWFTDIHCQLCGRESHINDLIFYDPKITYTSRDIT